MMIVEHKLFQPGNIHTRRRAIRLQIEGAAGLTVSNAAIRQLRRGFRRVRPGALDCPAWRRLVNATAPVPAAGVVEVVALVLQRYCYWPIRFCAWREMPSKARDTAPGELERLGIALYETAAEAVGLAAGEAAISLVQAMLDGKQADELFELFGQQITLLQKRTGAETPASDALILAAVAVRRGIPWSVMHRSHYVRLGLGRNSHVVKGTESSNTASINRAMVRDKSMTHSILSKAGLPVARQLATTSDKKAAKFARDIGFPVVVKPRDGNMGKGVTVGVQDRTQLLAAFERAQKISPHVVIESLIEGEEYRLMVVNGTFAGAVHRQPAQITGDGVSTVTELVAKENLRPEREAWLRGSMSVLKQMQIDDDALALLSEQGLDPQSVPEKGDKVYLRRESNVSRGGEGFDASDRLHPANRELAERVARVVGLDVCGIDFISRDPSVPWQENGAAICEVNSRPGMAMHVHAMGDKGDRIPAAIIDMLFPEGRSGRMPVIALLGEADQTRGLRDQILAAATAAQVRLGLVIPYETEAPIEEPGVHLLHSVSALEWETEIDAALIETTPAQLIGDGLGLERLDLAVIAAPDDAGAERQMLAALDRIAGDRRIAIGDPAALAAATSAIGVTGGPQLATDAGRTDAPPAAPHAMPQDGAFNVLFLGDVGFGESYMHHPRMAGLQETLGKHGHGYSLANLHGILGASGLTIANLEVPLCARPDPGLQGHKKYLGWSDPEQTVAALKQAGIGAVTLANNHSLDCGKEGISETFARLQKAGIAAFGAGSDAETAGHPFIHRFRIGGAERALVVFAGFEYRRSYDRRFNWYAHGCRGGIGMISPELVAGHIRTLRDILPNPIFVAFPHWGTDYEEVTTKQRDTAAALVAAGVDLIVGHGAHIAQAAEVIDGCPVLFNIGNFVWNTPGRFNRRDVLPLGLAVSLSIQPDMRHGPSLRVYPIITDNDRTRFQNRPVTEEELAGARDLLCSGLQLPTRTGRDAAGWYVGIDLPSRAVTGSRRDPVAAE
ncbi:cyanophycin synthetase [Paracoccus halophilus]|uniref:Cyanophycin synthetase n=1 Tax=Paracoccus halophilus TaxID=376733 RepID=A0A099F4H7_9RHOB|nr:CapA family protein [Paracoccus halophilus]KGJ05106.1 hypothetical protein IT41_06850 [Paracoccus halophilus]SFA44144.1 cyanophycin synthetase [Paracoccus halophilus]